MCEATERARTQVTADAESLRDRLGRDSGEVMSRLDTASSQLRHQLDSLHTLASRCSLVNTTLTLIYTIHVNTFK